MENKNTLDDKLSDNEKVQPTSMKALRYAPLVLFTAHSTIAGIPIYYGLNHTNPGSGAGLVLTGVVCAFAGIVNSYLFWKGTKGCNY